MDRLTEFMRFSHSRCVGSAAGCLLILAAHLHAAVHITTNSLPDGYVGTAYSQTLAANGGTAPYSWSLTVGQLPTGLGLSTDGVISGTPTGAGSYLIVVQVKDADLNSNTQALTLNIDPAVNITTTSLPGATVGLLTRT